MNDKLTPYDVIILGAGGAGLMCAGIAGQRGKKVLLLEHADKPGKKILISGGGRCNFTNLNVRPDCFISENQHFAKSALARYTPANFIELVNAHNISWHEKTRGQLFCDGSARQIVDMLLNECEKGNVELQLRRTITNINHTDGAFIVETNPAGPNGAAFTAPALVIATGGPSIPKMGATGFAYDIARQFKMNVVQPRPALVPLTLGTGEAMFHSLSGVACETITSIGKVAFREATLFTHKGLSGPAILQISSYWREAQEITVNFLPKNGPNYMVDAKRAQPKSKPSAALAKTLPSRLADTLSGKMNLQQDLAMISDKELLAAGQALCSWKFSPSGTEGFAKAEVTVGGIATVELSSKTMQAKKIPGLYAIGEAVDVTGWLGGFNFQWAWASGFVAGNAL